MAIAKDIFKFALCSFALFYLPGRFLISFLKKRYGPWEETILSFSAGLFLIPHIYYHLEGARLHNLFLTSVFLFSAVYFICLIPKFRLNIGLSGEKAFMVSLALAILIVSFLAIGSSGILYNNGMRFYQANAYDSMAQMAMVGELAKDPPWEFPFYSGLPLKGYYVGSFYWRALIQKATGINPIDLFFRYCPAFLFTLLVMLSFVTIKNILSSSRAAMLATFLIFLMGDLSWVFPVLDRLTAFYDIRTVYFGCNLLDWIIFNPPLAHGVLILFLGCYFLKYCEEGEDKRMRWVYIIYTGILFGSLFEYKAFLWAVALPALAMVGIKEYAFYRKPLFLKVALAAGTFSVLSFFRLSSPQAVSLFRFNVGYYPLSVLREMGVAIPEGVGYLFTMALAFILFLLGGLGIKITGFYKIYRYLKDWKKISPVTLFLIFSMAISFTLTHMFLLGSHYFNATYNFFAMFLLGISIFSAETITAWTDSLRPFLKIGVFSFILIIGIVSTVFSFLAYLPEYSKYKALTKGELAAMDYLVANSPRGAVVLTDSADRDWMSGKTNSVLKRGEGDRDSFISAMTSRRTVLECSWHMAMGSYAPDLKERKRYVTAFFNTRDEASANGILNKYDVSYVWVDKGKDLNFKKDYMLEKFFINQAVSIYRVKR